MTATWVTVITALIGLLAAAITGKGSVSEEQAAALNEQIPGFGTALQTTTSSVNGVAMDFTEWAATQSAANALGLGNPFGSPTGLVGNIGSFLGNVNIWLLLLGGLLVYYFFFRRDRSAF